MNKPDLYRRDHQNFKEGLGKIIRANFSQTQWCPEIGDTYIDVGSGPGDVFMDYVYPLLPSNYQKIVLSDISRVMLEYAESSYGSQEKREFKILDIGSKKGLPTELTGAFNHVTCLMVLHWVPDIRLVFKSLICSLYVMETKQSQIYFHFRSAIKNMSNLLHSAGGDCLLIFMPTSSHSMAYNRLKETKWSKYLKDIDRFISPLHYSKDAKEELKEIMENSGFSNIQIDLQHKKLVYETFASMKGK